MASSNSRSRDTLIRVVEPKSRTKGTAEMMAPFMSSVNLGSDEISSSERGRGQASPSEAIARTWPESASTAFAKASSSVSPADAQPAHHENSLRNNSRVPCGRRLQIASHVPVTSIDQPAEESTGQCRLASPSGMWNRDLAGFFGMLEMMMRTRGAHINPTNRQQHGNNNEKPARHNRRDSLISPPSFCPTNGNHLSLGGTALAAHRMLSTGCGAPD